VTTTSSFASWTWPTATWPFGPPSTSSASIVNEMAAFSMVSADIDGSGQDEIVLVTNDGYALILRRLCVPEIPEEFDLEDDDDNGENGETRQLAIFIDQQLDFSVSEETARNSSRYMSPPRTSTSAAT
jgi:hypothetical protein